MAEEQQLNSPYRGLLAAAVLQLCDSRNIQQVDNGAYNNSTSNQ